MKTFKIVHHGMSTIAVITFCLMMSMVSEEALAYDDLRDKDCMASSGVSLKKTIPEEEVDWEGKIGVALDCDEAYDYPLDFNADSNTDTIYCSGTNRWQPDYFPDCNTEILPAVMTVSTRIRGHMDACDNNSKSTSHKQFSCDGMETYCKVIDSPTFNCDDMNDGGDLGEVNLVVEISAGHKGVFKFSQNDVRTFEKELRVGVGVNGPLNENTTMETRYEFTCPHGSVSQMTSVGPRCRGCSIGQFLNSQKRCEPCAKGYFQNQPMKTVCKMCPGLKNSQKDSDVWRQVTRITKNRLYHVVSCPIVVSSGNGSFTVRQPSNVFDDGEGRKEDDDQMVGIRKVEGRSSKASMTTVTYFLVAIIAVLNIIVSY